MIGITQQVMTKLTGKDDYGTPKKVVNYIAVHYAKTTFEIDACASKYNHKCSYYITKDMNLFYHKLDRPTFMNPIYGKKGYRTFNKGKSDEYTIYNKYGTADFVRYAHGQHIKYDTTMAVLLFGNVSSSEYFQLFVGETPEDKGKNHCEVFHYPKRISFENEFGYSIGTPSLSSIVVVYDKRFGK